MDKIYKKAIIISPFTRTRGKNNLNDKNKQRIRHLLFFQLSRRLSSINAFSQDIPVQNVSLSYSSNLFLLWLILVVKFSIRRPHRCHQFLPHHNPNPPLLHTTFPARKVNMMNDFMIKKRVEA